MSKNKIRKSMPNQKAKDRKRKRRKTHEAIKKYKRLKKQERKNNG
jgi:hypothetical protein